MSGRNVTAQIREGMDVTSSDGKVLGKIAQVWIGADAQANSTPWDAAACLEVHPGFWGRARALYIPCPAVATVAGCQVTLNVDAAMADAMPWNVAPAWIRADDAKSSRRS